ncbi:hypothetical protein BMETH_746_4 [methanotrophic bacterial endosymbiont of Bathymodiolus sp.]|nr:hypothetical protein BMETH_746_4 [methanotrophic bacterial endosymbiont of Bathymodiolus sp.]
MGVFLVEDKIDDICISLPHARGGVSLLMYSLKLRQWSSPRPWGCF